MPFLYIEKQILLRTKWTESKTHIGFNISSKYVDPKTSATFGSRLALGKPYRLQVRVREESRVQILLNGKAIVTTKVAASEGTSLRISLSRDMIVDFKPLEFVAVP